MLIEKTDLFQNLNFEDFNINNGIMLVMIAIHHRFHQINFR